MEKITPEILLNAYSVGIFPMAEDASSKELHWYSPEERGIIPLEGFYVPGKLRRFYNKKPFEICVDRNFRKTMELCAEPQKDRKSTWINDDIINLYCRLHEMGFAHSVECYENNNLIGGLYGVALRGVFCGESMFSRRTNASKVALIKLVELLNEKGFILLDTQYITDHLKQFGAVEISREQYQLRLSEALKIDVKW